MSAWQPRYCAGAWQYKSDELICIIFNSINRGGGAVGLSVRLSRRRLGVQIRAVTDLSRKKQEVTAPLLNTPIDVSVTDPRR